MVGFQYVKYQNDEHYSVNSERVKNLREQGFSAILRRILFTHLTSRPMENNLDRYNKSKIITGLEESDELLSSGFDLSWYEMSI